MTERYNAAFILVVSRRRRSQHSTVARCGGALARPPPWSSATGQAQYCPFQERGAQPQSCPCLQRQTSASRERRLRGFSFIRTRDAKGGATTSATPLDAPSPSPASEPRGLGRSERHRMALSFRAFLRSGSLDQLHGTRRSIAEPIQSRTSVT